MESTNFLTREQAERLRAEFGSPLFVYSEEKLRETAEELLSFPAPYGLTVRYAMKANPTRGILKLFDSLGVQIDASSGYEAERAILAGIDAKKIMLTTQELPKNLKELVEAGVIFNACSFHQLEEYGKLFPGKEISVRINPGLGSGFNFKTMVGGSDASFGMWYYSLGQAKEIIEKYDLKVTKVHTHIGSGTDPNLWEKVSQISLDLLNFFPDANCLNLGGGFKVARMSYEKNTDIAEVGKRVAASLEDFYAKTGRKIHIEIEPGTYFVANNAVLLSTIQDISATDKYKFLKLDAGMTEIIRPTMYGAQHPIEVFSDSVEKEEYVVVGHCCESGDLLTPAPDNGEAISPRTLNKAAIGDILIIGGVGAYCAGMSAKHYNSFPEAAEVMLLKDGSFKLIRKRQRIEQVFENEI